MPSSSFAASGALGAECLTQWILDTLLGRRICDTLLWRRICDTLLYRQCVVRVLIVACMPVQPGQTRSNYATQGRYSLKPGGGCIRDLEVSHTLCDSLISGFYSSTLPTNVGGRTCLYIASRYGHLDVVAYLVGMKKELVDVADKRWWTDVS